MTDLRNSLGQTVTAGATIGLLKVVSDMLYAGMPPVYSAFSQIGRFGKAVFDMVMGFALDFVDQRVPQIEQWRIPSRWFLLGVMEIVVDAFDMVRGKVYASVNSDGTVKVDPSANVVSVHAYDGSVAYNATIGRVVETRWFKPVQYVIVTDKGVAYTESPYKLAKTV